MKKLVALLLFLCLSAPSFADNDKNITSKRSVSGKVADAYGQEIAGAQIRVVESGETFYADLEGNFHFSLSTDRSYSIIVNTIGFKPAALKSSHLGVFSEIQLQPLQ
jgi:hypothetical protein